MWGIISIGWHALILSINFKLQRFTPLHAPLVMLAFFLNTAVVLSTPLNFILIIQNINGLGNFIIIGLVLNANWVLTSLAVLINLIGQLLFLNVHYKLVDVGSILQLVLTAAIAIYSLRQSELVMRNDL